MQLANPIAQFFDLQGHALQSGYIFIGQPNTNPVTNPMTVYADSAYTIALQQPLRTINGAPALNGLPTEVFIQDGTNFSLSVTDKNGNVVFSNLNCASLVNAITFDGNSLAQQFMSRVKRVVSSIAILAALNPATYVEAFATGYYAASDGGGGNYTYNASTAPSSANGGTIIASTFQGATGCWVLQQPGPVSACQFGAKGDGVTDDTTRIQAALNAVSRLYLPPKTFVVSAALTPGFQGQCVEGAGRLTEPTGSATQAGTVVKQMSSTDVFAVTQRGFTITDLNITYGITPTAGACVNSSASSTCIERVYFGAPCYEAFKFTAGGTGHVISDFYVGGMIYSGLHVQGTNDVFIENGVMAVHNSTNCPSGVLIFDGYVQAVNLTNVDILGGVYSMGCINVGTAVSNRSSFCRFTNVYFDSSANGAHIDGCAGFVFTNCWFSNRPGCGAVIGDQNPTEGNIFIGCVFANCASHGAALYSNATFTTFSACYFVANGQASSGHGLYVAPNTKRFKVHNCVSYNGQGFSGTQQYGIYVDNGSSDFYQIVNNDTQNNAAGTIYDGGTGSNKSVSGNVGYNSPGSVTIPTVGASPYTYSNTKGVPQLVVVRNGTVSAITLFGLTVFTSTGQAFVLPPGQATTITYSAAPTLDVTDLF